MSERRESIQSRFDMLEHKVKAIEADNFKMREDHDEMMNILRNLSVQQAKTQTIVGGAVWVAGGFATVAGLFLQHFLNKLFP